MHHIVRGVSIRILEAFQPEPAAAECSVETVIRILYNEFCWNLRKDINAVFKEKVTET